MSATSAAGREHDDRQRRLDRADLLEDLEAAATGQHHVEDHEVEVAPHGAVATVDAVGGHLDRVALRAQRALDEVRDAALVLDEKDAHGPIVRRALALSVRELSRVP